MKNDIRINISQLLVFCSYIFIGILLIVNFPGEEYSYTEVLLYTVLIGAYFIIIGLVILSLIIFNVYIFEPFVIISLLYIAIFIYRPIHDLLYHSVQYGGRDLTEAGIKATILFTIGYIVFYVGYFSKKKGLKIINRTLVCNKKLSLNKLLFLWLVFYVFCLISTLSMGFSLEYIFSLGIKGERILENNTALLFLSNFATSLIVVWLMIVSKTKSLILKLSITTLTLLYLIIRNGRWLVLIMIFSPFIYYYIKKKKQPNLGRVFFVSLAALLVFSWMQMNRNNISSGQGLLFDGISLDTILAPFNSDLTTYTTFYGMTQNIPSNSPYMYGKTFMYTFILFIPRVIWENKPDNPIRDMIEYSLGELARANGRAVANFGEVYANFGAFAMILFMFLFGYIVSQLKVFYEKPTENRLIIYSVLYPLIFQWIARGDFSSNFYYTLFAFLPFIMQSIFAKLLNNRN